MNKNQFVSHIKNSSLLGEQEIKSLTDLSSSFPYCQISHILLAKATHNSNSMLANEKLSKAALYATSRKNLKEIIGKSETIKSDTKQKSKTELNTPPPTVKKESVKREKGKNTIADEIQATLKESQDLKNKQLKSSKEPNSRISKNKDDKSKVEDIKKEKKKKPVKKKPESKKEEITNDSKLGFSIFSSRLGNIISNEATDLISEYPFDTNPYRDVIAVEKLSKSAIIDEFIDKSPSISKLKSSIPDSKSIENLADKSIRKKSVPKTETLAKLYLSQGNKKKALKIYEDLLLKIPEKRTYFAAQIKKLKEE